MFYDDDADLSRLDGRTVAILGYGSQGHAHARNLKDSGVDVVVGLRPGSGSVEHARAAGLTVTDVGDAASRGDIVMVLLPDERHHDIWEESIKDGIAPGNLLMFGHGFSIHYKEVEAPPEVDAGYDPKLAYFECLHELKLIVDLMYEKGITGMRHSISNTAEYGDLTRGKRIISDETRASMKAVLGEIEVEGKQLRSMMSWIDTEFEEG